MASLNIDLDFPDHPKTKRLVGLLGKGSEMLLLRLWSYCGKFHAVDGALEGYADQEIEALAGWWGKPGAMLEAMAKGPSPWLEKTEKGYQCHDWAEHQGHLAVYKARAKNAALTRWKDKAGASSSASSTPTSSASSTPTSSALTVQYTAEQSTHPPNAPAESPTRRTVTLVPHTGQGKAPAVPQSTHTPTWEEVQTAALRLGPQSWEWRAKLWWLDMEAQGWKRHGHPISAWLPLLQLIFIYWESDGRPAAPPTTNRNRTEVLDTHTHLRELAIVEQAIDDIKRRAPKTSGGVTYSKEDYDRIKALAARRKEIKAKVTKVA